MDQKADHFFYLTLMLEVILRLRFGLVSDPLAGSDVVIFKGDVNYRRLLDDLHWPHTMSFEAITEYFPTSLITLRTLKGEIIVGLPEGTAEEIQADDPNWLINGKRGIIQFVNR